jgi:hypothetical protein
LRFKGTKYFGQKKKHCRLGSKNCIYIYSKNYVTDFYLDLRVPNILVDKKKHCVLGGKNCTCIYSKNYITDFLILKGSKYFGRKKKHCVLGGENCTCIYSKNYITDYFRFKRTKYFPQKKHCLLGGKNHECIISRNHLVICKVQIVLRKLICNIVYDECSILVF